jgi:hypothetical protein
MMRLVSVVLLACAGTVLAVAPAITRSQPLDVERVLGERFGFSAEEVGQVRDGQLVVKTLPVREQAELGVLGVIRIPDDKDRLVRWIRDVEGFRKAAELGLARKLSTPPTIADFGDLAFDAGELAALQACQPGKCALRLGDEAIGRFRTEVDWSAPDAGRRANLLGRQLMLKYVEAYLRGGDDALGAAHDKSKPRAVAQGFRALLGSATNLYALASPLASYLERFPQAQLPGREEFFYWAKGGAGPDPSITLNHLVITRDSTGGVSIANKQFYTSRYTDAALLVLSLASPSDGKGYYLLAGFRARSTLLEGFSAKLLRGKIEDEARSYTEIYLDWVRKSLAPA